jgi:putative ABC transport system permease protein
VLVAGQVAVSVVLLVAAGLFVRSFDAARRVDPGFGQHPAAMAWVGVSGGRDDGSALRGLERIQQRVAALPGVRTVGMAENVHLNTLSSSSSSILVDGVEPPPGRRGHDVDRTAIDTGFVAASGLRVVAGRNVTPDDDGDAPPVALVNEAFAARFWPGQSALGRRFRMADGTEREVVGVVNTARIRTLGEEPRPFMYLPLAQQQVGVVWLVARTEGPADGLVAALLREIRAEDPRAFVLSAYTMQRHLDIMALPAKLGAAALGGFALLALVMASIGLYGTVNYAVAQRTREVGIRLSLGAGPGAVVRLLLWSGLRLVLAGAAAGLAAALLLARLLQGLLFGVGALDPLTFALVPAVLTVVALAAAWVPARRAGRISPVSALRAD